MALDEIYVPYALPDGNWVWRAALDFGEYNLGQYSESLEAGVDVPTNAVFFDEARPTRHPARGIHRSTCRMRSPSTSVTGVRCGTAWIP